MLANYINAIVQKLKIIIVVAVGNREKATTFCPACAQEAISVGSLSKDGNSVADFSTPGSIHLSKPNVVAQGHGGIFFPDGPIPFEGTSFAAPVVSGIITALVLNNPSSATLISNFYMATEYLDNTLEKKGLGKVSLPKLMEVLENAQKFILQVQKIDDLFELKQLGNIIFVDDLINVVVLETEEGNLSLIENDPNVTQVQESRRGMLLEI